MYVNDVARGPEIEVSNPREFRHVMVYAGMKTAAKAKLRNLEWTSCKSSSVRYIPPTPPPPFDFGDDCSKYDKNDGTFIPVFCR